MSHPRIVAVAAAARFLMLPRWKAWRVANDVAPVDPRPESTGMCRFSSCYLKLALEEATPDETWSVVGGWNPEGPGGYRDDAGAWHGHYWLTHEGTGTILDVTADQFGGPDVVLAAPGGEDAGRYLPTCGADEIERDLAPDRSVSAEWFAQRGEIVEYELGTTELELLEAA